MRNWKELFLPQISLEVSTRCTALHRGFGSQIVATLYRIPYIKVQGGAKLWHPLYLLFSLFYQGWCWFQEAWIFGHIRLKRAMLYPAVDQAASSDHIDDTLL
jgi:hypothetical protein